MGGFFGAISHKNCIYDVFFGTDYHSHLGTRRAGLAFYDTEKGFQRQIHSIENTPFRTKFDDDMAKFSGNAGIGCISDTDPQPLLVRSHLGMFAISTVGIINNAEQLVAETFSGPRPSVHGHVLRQDQHHRADRRPHQPAGQPDRGHPLRAGGHRRLLHHSAADPRRHHRRPGPAGAAARAGGQE